jgi:hypothetical protein
MGPRLTPVTSSLTSPSFTPPRLFNSTLLNPRANTLENRVGRSSIGALGGTQSLGTFSFKEPPTITGLPKSYSVSADGSPSYLTLKWVDKSCTRKFPLRLCLVCNEPSETFPEALITQQKWVSVIKLENYRKKK